MPKLYCKTPAAAAAAVLIYRLVIIMDNFFPLAAAAAAAAGGCCVALKVSASSLAKGGNKLTHAPHGPPSTPLTCRHASPSPSRPPALLASFLPSLINSPSSTVLHPHSLLPSSLLPSFLPSLTLVLPPSHPSRFLSPSLPH